MLVLVGLLPASLASADTTTTTSSTTTTTTTLPESARIRVGRSTNRWTTPCLARRVLVALSCADCQRVGRHIPPEGSGMQSWLRNRLAYWIPIVLRGSGIPPRPAYCNNVPCPGYTCNPGRMECGRIPNTYCSDNHLFDQNCNNSFTGTGCMFLGFPFEPDPLTAAGWIADAPHAAGDQVVYCGCNFQSSPEGEEYVRIDFGCDPVNGRYCSGQAQAQTRAYSKAAAPHQLDSPCLLGARAPCLRLARTPQARRCEHCRLRVRDTAPSRTSTPLRR